jgi:hypothetical protein
MKIPFTIEQFFSVFKTYNTAIWPAQVLAYVIGLAALALAIHESRLSARIISGILAIFWIWMGAVYHILYFREINPAALTFGIFFILQGLLFLVAGTVLGRLSFRFSLKAFPIMGGCFILYAMVAYPLLGIRLGHSYPGAPMFGVAPCPTAIFTFGMLLWTSRSVPVYLLVIPLLWSIVGMSAAVSLHVPQDYGLVIAGILGTVLILIKNRKGRGIASVSSL